MEIAMNNFVLTLAFVALVTTGLLAACGDNGKHTGQLLQDCAAIQPNQREDAATAIKGMTSRDQAVAALAAKFNITPEAAKACLK